MSVYSAKINVAKINSSFIQQMYIMYGVDVLHAYLDLTSTYDTDTLIQMQGLTELSPIDSAFLKTITISAIMDIVQKRSNIPITADINLIIKGIGDIYINFDSVFLKYGITKNDDIDTLLEKQDITVTNDIDVMLRKYGLTRTDTIDSLLKKLDITVTDSLDILLQKIDISKTNDLDSLITKLGITKTEFIDTIVKKLNITKTKPIQILIAKLGLTKTINFDLLIRMLDISLTNQLDTIIFKIAELQMVNDSIFKRLNITSTRYIDTLIYNDKCEACKSNKATYVVRISGQALCWWCYNGKPIPQDGIRYQTTDWSVCVTQ